MDRSFRIIYILALLGGIFLPPVLAIVVGVHICLFVLLLYNSESEYLFSAIIRSYIYVVIFCLIWSIG
jgi:hypothetical protein